jgi:hypothetical protein
MGLELIRELPLGIFEKSMMGCVPNDHSPSTPLMVNS